MSAERTRIVFDAEVENLELWAKEKASIKEFEIKSADLLIRLTLSQPETGLAFYLEADFELYRTLPPKFTFSHEPWDRRNTHQDYPKQVQNPFGGGSIFHDKPCLCLHFNRLAYADLGGPHNDWGGPERWLRAATGGQYVRAASIPQMLSVIYSRFVGTRGRLRE